MREISLSEFRRLTVSQSKEALPLILTADGQVFALIAKPDDVIILTDLAVRVQKQLRALEQKVRLAMPEAFKIYASDVKV